MAPPPRSPSGAERPPQFRGLTPLVLVALVSLLTSCVRSGFSSLVESCQTGAVCDDGLYCTVDDRCDEDSRCVGDVRDCSEAGEQASCDEVAERCTSASTSSADLNGDGCVDCRDHAVMEDQRGQPGADLSADLDGNGAVDGADFALLMDDFREGCTGPNPSSVGLLGVDLGSYENKTLFASVTCADASCEEIQFQAVVSGGSASGGLEHRLDFDQDYVLDAYLDADADRRCGAADLAWRRDVLSGSCRQVVELSPAGAGSLQTCTAFTVLGDLDGDDCVDGADLAAALAGHGQAGSYRDGDLDGDGLVDDDDIATINANYAVPCGPSPLIGWAKLSDSSSYSFVDLAVDWDRSLAYVASRQAGVCVSIIDLDDPTQPSLLVNLGPGLTHSTEGDSCLGVTLLASGTLLVLTAEDAGAVEVWDLGNDPRALQLQRLSMASTGRPRRVDVWDGSGNDAGPWQLYVARDSGGSVAERFEIGSDGMIAQPGDSAADSCSNNDVAAVGGQLLLYGCWDDAMPVQVLDAGSLTEVTAFEMDNGGSSGFWSAAASSDGSRVFLGGWIAAFFAVEQPGFSVRQQLRFDNSSVFRAAAFFDDGARIMLAAVSSDRHLEIWDASDSVTPELESRTLLAPLERELYGVTVDATQRRAVVISNRGYVAVIDLDALRPPSSTWPTF